MEPVTITLDSEDRASPSLWSVLLDGILKQINTWVRPLQMDRTYAFGRISMEAGEMAQCLEAVAILLEDLISIPSAHVAT